MGQGGNMEEKEKQVTEEVIIPSTEEKAGEDKPMTFDELLSSNKDYQSAYDKKITDATKTAVNNALNKWKIQQSEDASEAERLATMSEKEKTEYKLQQQVKRADEAEKKLSAFNLKQEAQKIALSDDINLDVEFLDFIDFGSAKAETIKDEIMKIKGVFDKAVEKRVNERLREPSPEQKNKTNEDNKLNHFFGLD